MKKFLSLLLFFPLLAFSDDEGERVMVILPDNETMRIQHEDLIPIRFMPGLYVGEVTESELKDIEKRHPEAEVNSFPDSKEELTTSVRSILLETPEHATEPLSNWWDAGFTGKGTVIGVLDSGVPDNYAIGDQLFTRQSALNDKKLIVNRGPDSAFDQYLNGVRTAHGTGVTCIYTGVAKGSENFLITLAGDSDVDDTDWGLTLVNLDWLLMTADQPKPNVINYSFGNGPLIEDWSFVAQTVDYIVDEFNVVWVKSAGNTGWVAPTDSAPFANTLTVPADSYNAIVVANMNNTVYKGTDSLTKTSDRSQHSIMPSSSRGPTRDGRRKPDLTAPGNDTRTCAPQTSVYAVPENPTFKQYTTSMQYDPITETRLVGGTSMATPHVGAAAAIIYDSGITDPMSIKALLINSADTWTDELTPHQAIGGSKWNRTYGWGYLNMNQAFEQRENLYQVNIRPHQTICYQGDLRAQDKVTLVWEKHLHDPFTPMKLELYERIQEVLMDEDDSQIDNVLQVSAYPYDLHVGLIRITNLGKKDETVALASGQPLRRALCKP